MPFLLSVPAAFANIAMSAAPDFNGGTYTVGDTNKFGSFQITNTSNAPPENTSSITICTSAGIPPANCLLNAPGDSIRMTPACGVFPSGGDCPAGAQDPGVFRIKGADGVSNIATGESGTACAGTTFTIQPSPTFATTGQVQFAPSAPVVLGPPSSGNNICRIDFRFDVLKTPTHPLPGSGTGPGNPPATAQLGTAAAVSNAPLANGSFGSGTGSSSVHIVPVAPPSFSTTAVTGVQPGATNVTDTATITAVAPPPFAQPTGSITFTLYGPNPIPLGTCVPANQVFTSTKTIPVTNPVTPAPYMVTSDPVTPPLTTPGKYYWVASYSGDASYLPATTGCGDNNETTLVNQATPTITTKATSPVTVGSGTISDTATLSGGFNPTGNITFRVYGPGDTMCATPLPFVSTKTVAGAGSYTSDLFTPTMVGTYRWIATYSGDTNNAAVATACNDTGEASTVQPVTPTIVTAVSPTVAAGGMIFDTATLSNAFNPTGSITFTLYAPADTGCTTSIFTSVKGVTANGPYTSTSYTTTQAGTFHWIATYSGDLNNAKVATLCTDEPLVVTTVTPTIVTKASPSVAVGGQVTDTATLSNGVNPTGSITFKLYGPTDANCTAGPVFTSAPTTVAGNGSYTSAPPFTPTTPGTYHWIATYSGDATNATVATGCLDLGESVNVTKIVTTASPPVPAGNGIFDTATLSGGFNPTGSILFKLYGPADTNCTAAPIFNSTKSVTANGNYQSDPFGANTAGTYRWIASYSGDTNNAAATTACNDAGESVIVTPVTPSIVTNASPASPAGTPITDTATLSGGVNPTGSITFKLYMGANCAGTVLSMSSRTVTANGNYTSDPFTTTAAGTYHWVASYSGDATNAAVTTACLDTGENVVVGPATPAIMTQASAPTTVGGTISDTANLTGGVNPIGNIVFKVYLNDATCTTPTVFNSTVPVNGDNTYPSGTFTVTTPGTYRFVATFTPTNGNNATVSTSCSDLAEAVVVSPAATTLVTNVSGPVPVGGTITDTATLAGGVAPVGGSITFNFFGPDNNTCAGIPIFMSTKTVTGNGNVTSDPFTVPAAGAYRVVASYTGDGRNAPAGPTFCQDAAEVTAGTKASPAIVTAVSANVTINGSISDTATLSLGFNPTGSITFKMYGPNPANCSGTPVFMSTKTVNGNGNYVSDSFAPPAVGSYTFVATYTGDGNNNPAGPTICNDPTETAQVLPAVIGIVTTASGAGSVTVSQPVTDTATISGGVPPFGGTLTFRLYNNNTCTGTPLSMSTRTVTADGNYTSDPFVTATAGTYHWTATYSGDASNGAAGPTSCTDPAETVQVLPLPQISVTKVANPLTRPEPGGSFTFTVQVSNPSTVEAVKITSLFDNIYGDLSTRPGSTCGTLIGVTLAPSPGPGNVSAPCTFTGPFTGRGGDSQTDTVTVTGVDIHGVVVTATAQATVSLTTIAPSISVTKVANPLSLPAPGGNFTFTVTVTNTNLVDPLTITALVDNIYGNLATRAGSSCGLLIGTVLAPGATSPPCSFTGPFTGVSGASQTDTVTATGVDSHGTTVTATAQATVILTPGVLPQIRVTKAANPLSLPEPGGTFTFTAQVSNPSTVDPVKITSLIDNIYGNLATRPGSTCGALIGVTLAPAPAPGATSAPCTFTGPFTGVSGASQTDTITVTGVDSNGNTVTATAQATVTLTPPILPQIKVTKAANPVSLPAPGGTFTFTVQVSNPSAVDPVKITNLVDNIYGDLATRAGSTCGTLIGVTLAPGATSAPCSFTGPFTGVSGASQTDTVTVTGVDTAGHTVTAMANATVILTPGATPVILVTKAANPLSLPAPGGTFTFTVTVINPSTQVPVKITSLVDNIYGNLATRAGSTCGALIGVTLAPGATSAPCSFTGPFSGASGASQTDTVTVTGVDNNGNVVTATAQATVTLTPANTPVIAVTKAASPPSLPAPGGNFTFTVQVRNPSAVVPIKITSLVDNIYGDLATRAGSTCGALIGTTLAPGGISAPCTFTGPFNGASGASQTDTVTVIGVDSNGNTATATAQATVVLTPAPVPPVPMLTVSKVANPLSLPAPGGNFTFTVQVTNPSTVDPVKITSLIDNIYGDLSTRPGSTCGALIGVTLAPGATSAPCSFTGPFTGNGGDRQTDTVTATGVDTNGVMVMATAMATVTLTTGATPSIAVTKAANPLTLPAPGGNFTFTVTVTNTSTNDPVKITSVVDNVYGDLATRAGSTCGALIGVTLQPGATSAPCSFTGPFTGAGGASQTDTVTVGGVDTHGVQVSNTARAIVSITSVSSVVAPPAILAFTGNESGGRNLLASGLIVSALALLYLAGRRRRID